MDSEGCIYAMEDVSQQLVGAGKHNKTMYAHSLEPTGRNGELEPPL